MLSTLLPQLQNEVDEFQKLVVGKLQTMDGIVQTVSTHQDSALFQAGKDILANRILACKTLLYIDGQRVVPQAGGQNAHKLAVQTMFDSASFKKMRADSGNVEPISNIEFVKSMSERAALHGCQSNDHWSSGRQDSEGNFEGRG